MKNLVFFLLVFVSQLGNSQTYSIVLETDFDGSVSSGSKEELISFIREGKPLRVGWQFDFDGDSISDLEHWIDATFISILKQEVFTQIDPIFAQGPNESIPQVEIYSDNTKWTAVIGTNGILLNRFIQKDSDIPELIFDDSLNLSEQEKNEMIEQEEKRKKAMKEVNSWKVATFWSIQK